MNRNKDTFKSQDEGYAPNVETTGHTVDTSKNGPSVDAQSPDPKSVYRESEPIIADSSAKQLTYAEQVIELKEEHILSGIKKIHEAIDEQYDRILDDRISASKAITEWAHQMLAEARQIVLEAGPEHSAEAERKIQQVRARMARAEISQRDARRWAGLVSLWGLLWFFIFIALIASSEFSSSFVAFNKFLPENSFINTLIQTFAWGGFGGAAYVFYDLANQVNNHQYSAAKNPIYLSRPFTGMVLGGITYFILALGLLASGQSPPDVVNDEPTSFLLYLSAWLVGFNQVRTYHFLDGAINRVFPGISKPTDKEDTA